MADPRPEDERLYDEVAGEEEAGEDGGEDVGAPREPRQPSAGSELYTP